MELYEQDPRRRRAQGYDRLRLKVATGDERGIRLHAEFVERIIILLDVFV